MPDSVEGALVSVEHTDAAGKIWSVETNSGTKAEAEASLEPRGEPDEQASASVEPDISKAASELGKKGGKAAAKARAKQAHEQEKAEVGKAEPGPEIDEREGAAEELDEGEDKPLGKPRDDPRARVQQVTREHAETKRQLEAERREKEEMRRRLDEIERRTRTPEEQEAERRRDDSRKPPTPPAKPQAEDYDDYEKYLDARDEWNLERGRHEAAVHTRAREHADRVTGIMGTYREAVQKHFGEDREFLGKFSEEVLGLRSSLVLDRGEAPSGRNWIADELVMSPDSAARMMLFFTEHPEELQRVASLRTPREVTREMAMLYKALDAATAGASSEGRPVSRAKPPVVPVPGGPAADESGGYREGMTLDEYLSRTDPKIFRSARRR